MHSTLRAPGYQEMNLRAAMVTQPESTVPCGRRPVGLKNRVRAFGCGPMHDGALVAAELDDPKAVRIAVERLPYNCSPVSYLACVYAAHSSPSRSSPGRQEEVTDPRASAYKP